MYLTKFFGKAINTITLCEIEIDETMIKRLNLK